MKVLKCLIVLIGLCGMIFLSCWERQDEKITAPETPKYDISGRVVSSLTNEPLSQVKVILTGRVKYNDQEEAVNFIIEQVTAENGTFILQDVPGGFPYSLILENDGYKTEANDLIMSYMDRDIGDRVIEKLLVLEKEAFFDSRVITGIAFKQGSLWIADALNEKIIELDDDLNKKREIAFLTYKLSGLAYDGEWFWTSDPDKNIVYQFQIIDEWDHIKLGDIYPSPKNYYNPDKIVDLLDISCFNSEVWACTDQISTKYFRLNLNEAGTADYFESPIYHPTGIYVDSNKVYIVSQYGGESKLYLIDKETNTTIGYYVFLENAGLITSDGNYFLIANENSVRKYFIN